MKRSLAILLVICMICTMMACDANAGISTGSVNYSGYYYSQLNDFEKEIYNNLASAKESFINNEKVLIARIDTEKEQQMFSENNAPIRAYMAYYLDNPISWMWFDLGCVDINFEIDENPVDGFLGGNWYYFPKDGGNYYLFENEEELREALRQVETTTREFVDTLEGNESEKLKDIHDWIIQGAEYDHNDGMNSDNPYGALIEKKAVCSGYAAAYKYVADMANLDVVYVAGTSSGAGHAWNYVKTEGEWTLVDVTWDLGGDDGFLFVDIEIYMYLGMHVPDESKGFSYKYFIK